MLSDALTGVAQGYVPTRRGASEEDWTEALRLLESMARQRVEAAEPAFSAGIDGCARGSAWAQALGLLGQLSERHVEPSAQAYNAGIRATEVLGAWPEAFELQRAMEYRGISHDSSTYSASISSCMCMGAWERSVAIFALFRNIAQTRLRMDTTMFNAALTCSVGSSHWHKAWRMLRSMSRRNVEADRATYATTMAGVMGGGGWHWALSVLGIMEEGGLVLPAGKEREALKLLSS